MSGAAVPMEMPFLPPLAGSAPLPSSGLTLTRLVTSLGTVAVVADLGGEEAMAVFRDRALVMAAARRGASVITGQEALGAISAAPVEQLRLYEIDPELAGLVGAYFLPTVVEGLPAAAVEPELFLRSFARAGQVACLVVQTDQDLGLAFVGGGESVLAYTRSAGEIGGVEQLAGLLDQPDARLVARAGAEPAAHSPRPPRAGHPVPASPAADRPSAPLPAATPEDHPSPPPPRTTPEPSPPAPPPSLVTSLPPPPAQQPAPRQDALAAFLRATGAGPAAGTTPVAGAGAPPPERPAQPASSPRVAEEGPELMDAVIAEARSVLGRNSARVEDVLASVEPTRQAIEQAVRALRDRGMRLIRPEKLDEAVERMLAVLSRRT